jgi:hypothetical protein
VAHLAVLVFGSDPRGWLQSRQKLQSSAAGCYTDNDGERAIVDFSELCECDESGSGESLGGDS